MFPFFHVLLAVYGSTIIYLLSLTFIGKTLDLRRTLFTIIIYGIIIYISKSYFFNFYPVFHTLVIAIACILLMHFINDTPWHWSVIGTLLTFIIIIIGSHLIMCPLAIQFGFDLSTGIRDKADWFILSILELIPALLVLIVLRFNSFSIMKIFKNIQG